MDVADLKQERPPFVRFERVAVEDPVASRVAGRYVSRDVDMAFVTPPYSKDVFKQEAADWLADMQRQHQMDRLPKQWLDLFNATYEAFLRGQEAPLNGTPIKEWGVISPAQRQNLIAMNILTVEDLAAMNEEGQRRIGMGGLDLKRKAQAWLQSLTDNGAVTMKVSQLQNENDLLKGNVARLEQQVQELMAAVRAQQSVPVMMQPVVQDSQIHATDIIDEPEDLAAKYKAIHGRNPHPSMKLENLRAAVGG